MPPRPACTGSRPPRPSLRLARSGCWVWQWRSHSGSLRPPPGTDTAECACPTCESRRRRLCSFGEGLGLGLGNHRWQSMQRFEVDGVWVNNNAKRQEKNPPEVSSNCPSAENVAERTVPLIWSSPTDCLERRLTSGILPSFPRKATRGLSREGQAAKLSRLRSGHPKTPATRSTLEASRSKRYQDFRRPATTTYERSSGGDSGGDS